MEKQFALMAAAALELVLIYYAWRAFCIWRRNDPDSDRRDGTPKGHSNATNNHHNCRRRGLCASSRGQEQDCWHHGSNRKHSSEHNVYRRF